MRYLPALLMLVFLSSSVQAQPVDEKHLDELETACAFGLEEACDELYDLENEGKSVALTLCNRTPEDVFVAIANEVGKVKENRFHVRGWWTLMPEECKAFWEWPVKDAALHVPFLHLMHIQSGSGAVWGGDAAFLCTPSEDFDITGDYRGDCKTLGYLNIDLFEGGFHTKGYTLDLTR